MAMIIEVDGFDEGAPIPEKYAFCAGSGMGSNINPRVRWTGAPEGTRSFALVCVDPDAPTDATDVNQPDRTVPASLPRADFGHWVLVDIPPTVTEILEGADSNCVTPHGKSLGEVGHGVRGKNDYTSWFAGDEDMEGVYGGYDGPCPPYNDELVHRYVFTIYALDVEGLGLEGEFGHAEARAAIEGHVLDEASKTGTYTLNAELR